VLADKLLRQGNAAHMAHTRLIRAALPDGREILLDGHAGYGSAEGLVPSHPVLIGLRPEEATIVAAEQA
jgi:hypothetical protein